jgi:hypothetical protein
MVAVVLFFLAFIVAGFLPLPGPDMTQAQIIAMYQNNGPRILAGMVFMMIAGMFMAPMIGVISQQMDRMEGVPSALSYAQIAAGAAGMIFFFVPAVMFMVTAYRPDRPPELTVLMNDASWIMAVLPWPPAFMENMVIAAAILMDRGTVKVFPRWVAWMNFFVCGGFLPGTMLIFVKSGPFAWNGLFGFLIPGTVFSAWFICMTWALLRAISQEQGASQRAGSPAGNAQRAW